MSKLRLDDVEWKDFKLNNLFRFELSKGDNQASQLEDGNYPLVSSGINLNGITKFIKNGDGKSQIFSKNTITIDMFGQAFYHEYDFYSVSHGRVNILFPLFLLNKYTANFIIAEINKSLKEIFSYNRMCSQKRLNTVKIMLPIDSNGNPNWRFMEDYVKQEMKEQSQKIVRYYENKLLKLGFELLDLEVEWKDFKLGELFDFKRGNQNNMSKCINGNIPLVSAKKVDNGLKAFIEKNDKDLYPPNILTLNNDGDGGVGLAFYQPFETALDTHVTALIPKYTNLSKFELLFLSISIKQQRGKFSHGYSLNNNRLSNQKIVLPSDKNGNPNWEYMRLFMQKIEKENISKVLEYIYIYIYI